MRYSRSSKRLCSIQWLGRPPKNWSPSKTRRWRATQLKSRPLRLSPSSAGRPQTSSLITATFVRLSLRSVIRPKTLSWLQLSRFRVSRSLALSMPRCSLSHATTVTARCRGAAAAAPPPSSRAIVPHSAHATVVATTATSNGSSSGGTPTSSDPSGTLFDFTDLNLRSVTFAAIHERITAAATAMPPPAAGARRVLIYSASQQNTVRAAVALLALGRKLPDDTPGCPRHVSDGGRRPYPTSVVGQYAGACP